MSGWELWVTGLVYRGFLINCGIYFRIILEGEVFIYWFWFLLVVGYFGGVDFLYFWGIFVCGWVRFCGVREIF